MRLRRLPCRSGPGWRGRNLPSGRREPARCRDRRKGGQFAWRPDTDTLAGEAAQRRKAHSDCCPARWDSLPRPRPSPVVPTGIPARRGQSFALINSKRHPPFRRGQLTSAGIQPQQLRVVVAKAAVAFRAPKQPMAGTIITVEKERPTAVNPGRFKYRQAKSDLSMIGCHSVDLREQAGPTGETTSGPDPGLARCGRLRLPATRPSTRSSIAIEDDSSASSQMPPTNQLLTGQLPCRFATVPAKDLRRDLRRLSDGVGGRAQTPQSRLCPPFLHGPVPCAVATSW